ncbi:MAG: hypothetical protein LBP53_02215 [Candidatus Peribacteria bacterium]|nr:hypothetical protein [Candidatus Peribacteria bacterium]
MMQEFLHLRREELRLHLDDELPADTLQRIQNAYHAHTVDKQPLEYLLGHVDFF